MRSEEKIKPKVCFVLPEKSEDTATHFAHKWELVRELKDDADFFVVQPTFAGMARMKIAYLFRGCRTFYVHYSFKGALFAIALTRMLGGRVFYWNCGMPWLYKRGWFEERLFRFILRRTILVIATEGLADAYAKRYGLEKKHIRVVPNYIRISRLQHIAKEEARRELNLPQDKKIILFLHRLSRRKGAHVLPDIIKEFSARNDVLFLIVGEGPERKNVELQISSLKMQNCARFEGSVPNGKVPAYVSAADIYLMPSEEEGMPNALLEAMAAGVPFVASDVAAVREMTPPATHEFVLPYGDTHIFSEKIKKLLADEELQKQVSFEEQEWVRRYDVSIVAPQYLGLFQE